MKTYTTYFAPDASDKALAFIELLKLSGRKPEIALVLRQSEPAFSWFTKYTEELLVKVDCTL